jgi:hypothetical protein
MKPLPFMSLILALTIEIIKEKSPRINFKLGMTGLPNSRLKSKTI